MEGIVVKGGSEIGEELPPPKHVSRERVDINGSLMAHIDIERKPLPVSEPVSGAVSQHQRVKQARVANAGGPVVVVRVHHHALCKLLCYLAVREGVAVYGGCFFL